MTTSLSEGYEQELRRELLFELENIMNETDLANSPDYNPTKNNIVSSFTELIQSREREAVEKAVRGMAPEKRFLPGEADENLRFEIFGTVQEITESLLASLTGEKE